jgi:hypothetical protein
VGIRFVDGKKIFKCCLHFCILIYVVPAVLLLERLCIKFAASGALIQTNTFSFCIFRIFILFSERGKESCNAHANTDVTLFERVTCPLFVSGLKGIGFLFAMCKRVIDTACKIEKSAKIKE